MRKVPIEKFAKAMAILEKGYLDTVSRNNDAFVTNETLVWSEYFIKKMLLVLADVERGKIPRDMDIDFTN